MQSAKHSRGSLIFGSLGLTVCLMSTTLAQETQHDAPEPPKIIRKSGGVFQGSAIRRVEPAYPPLAKAARISGSVVVEVTASEDGSVVSARAISGHPLLKDAAVAAAREWKFTPTKLSEVPVKVIGTITFNFNFDYSKDIDEMRRRLEVNPNAAELHYKLAELLRYDRQLEKAIDEYEMALRIEGDFVEAYVGLAEAYQAAAHIDEAIEACRNGLATAKLPGHAEMLNVLLGQIYLKQNRNQEAVEAFKQAVINNPDSVQAHFQLGLTYLKIGDRQSAMNEHAILKDLSEDTAEMLRQSLEKNN